MYLRPCVCSESSCAVTALPKNARSVDYCQIVAAAKMNDSNVEDIFDLFPFLSKDDIKQDLTITRDVQLTINRVLDNEVNVRRQSYSM